MDQDHTSMIVTLQRRCLSPTLKVKPNYRKTGLFQLRNAVPTGFTVRMKTNTNLPCFVLATILTDQTRIQSFRTLDALFSLGKNVFDFLRLIILVSAANQTARGTE